MRRRASAATAWGKLLNRSWRAVTAGAVKAGTQALGQAAKPAIAKRKPPAGEGQWLPGVAMGAAGMRRFRLYRPPGVKHNERLPLVVMLHGCGQDAKAFASSTRMNRLAQKERFLVLYPEQDRLANAQGCWNWFDTRSGLAYNEAALIMKAIDQVCLLYPIDRARVVIAGLSAGASMAALVVSRHPSRFRALVMHSGIPPGSAHSAWSALSAMHGMRTPRPLEEAPEASKMAATDLPWPPLMVIHGDRDRIVSPQNAHAAVQVWAEAAGAKAGPARTVQRGQRHPMQVTDFKHRGRTVAALVEVERLAHAWSGGMASQPYGDAQGPDASRMVWAFALKQFRQA